ncbi:hypothetical protein MP228_007131 [Amoeboaphelidium protococcarum]|nr:hypothetical protein MP228_007131 [Amoeboaphelidium protococcarum]
MVNTECWWMINGIDRQPGQKVVGIVQHCNLSIGGVWFSPHVFVVEQLPCDLILGRPFQIHSQYQQETSGDGTTVIGMIDPEDSGRQIQISVEESFKNVPELHDMKALKSLHAVCIRPMEMNALVNTRYKRVGIIVKPAIDQNYILPKPEGTGEMLEDKRIELDSEICRLKSSVVQLVRKSHLSNASSLQWMT